MPASTGLLPTERATLDTGTAPSLAHSVPRKLAWRLMPFLGLLFVAAFLDRANISFAALTMNQDLHMSSSAYGFAAGVFFLGYALFEIPSNVLLERVGARRWIARIAITWGITAAAMALVQGPLSLYALRFMLGIAEAGFFPGIIFYLTLWFPAPYRARITGAFLIALPLCYALGGPLSTWVLGLQLGGLKGWQWLFLLEGLPSVLMGFLVLFYLEDGPEDAAWLSTPEKQWLQQTLAAEHGSADTHALDLWQALLHPRVWLLGLVYFGVVAGLYAIGFWLPQIVKGFGGLSNVQAGLLSAIPYLVAAPAMMLWGRHSDTSGERHWHIALPAFAGALGLAASGWFVASPVAALVALTLGAIGAHAALAPFWALPTGMLRGVAAAGGIALVNSIGGAGAFVGSWLTGVLKDFTGSHATGLYVLSALAAMSGLLVLGLRYCKPPASPGA
jgi:ACS family tartrate transporter-like MFS transporter